MILSNLKDVDDDFFSVIIIGSGPAGISTALKLEEYKIKTLLLEAGSCSFPVDDFLSEIVPWVEEERSEWSVAGETLEGAGCWSPLFPARSDDVWLAAIATVKHLERSIDGTTQIGLTVLEQLGETGVGFQIAEERGS